MSEASRSPHDPAHLKAVEAELLAAVEQRRKAMGRSAASARVVVEPVYNDNKPWAFPKDIQSDSLFGQPGHIDVGSTAETTVASPKRSRLFGRRGSRQDATRDLDSSAKTAWKDPRYQLHGRGLAVAVGRHKAPYGAAEPRVDPPPAQEAGQANTAEPANGDQSQAEQFLGRPLAPGEVLHYEGPFPLLFQHEVPEGSVPQVTDDGSTVTITFVKPVGPNIKPEQN